MEDNKFSPISVDYNYISSELKLPIVIKTVSAGAAGKGTVLCRNIQELQDIVDTMQILKVDTPMLAQEYIECGNKAIRVWLVAGKAYAAVEGYAKADGFKSCVALEGHGRPYPLTPQLSQLVENAARLIGLTDYGCVDILPGEDGFKICEAHAYANFTSAEKIAKVKLAEPQMERFIEQAKLV